MIRTLITAAAGFAIFSAGSAINTSASAGGGAAFIVTKSSAPSPATAKNRAAKGRNGGTEITEFSSSSGKRSGGQR